MLNEAKVIYFWYYGGMEESDIDKAREAIRNKDFMTFRSLRIKYSDREYNPLPTYATIFLNDTIVGEINVAIPEGFILIDTEDSECGKL